MALKSSKRNTKNSETSAVREKAIAAPGVLFEEVAPCRSAARITSNISGWPPGQDPSRSYKNKAQAREQPPRFRKVPPNHPLLFPPPHFSPGT